MLRGFYNEALECYHEIEHYHSARTSPHFGSIMLKLGRTCSQLGHYDDALRLLQSALELQKRLFGEKHSSTLAMLPDLADILVFQGEYRKAEGYVKTTLRLQLEKLGANRYQGKYDEALKWAMLSFAEREKLLGKSHISVAASKHLVSTLYFSQGQYEKALDWGTQALDMFRHLVGDLHLSTCAIQHDMGFYLTKTGRYDEALEMYQNSLNGKLKSFERSHPSVLATVNNISTPPFVMAYRHTKVKRKSLAIFIHRL